MARGTRLSQKKVSTQIVQDDNPLIVDRRDALIAAIFDMEGEDNPEQPGLADSPTALTNGKSPTTTTPTTPSVTSPPRRRRPRLQDTYGLPSSLSSLRPSSMPNIQSLRAPVTRRVESDRPRSHVSKDALREKARTNGDKGDEEPLSPDSREAHILSLVAASVPSHRSAWKKDSKAWQVFVERRDRRSLELGPVSIEEEDESDEIPRHDSARLGRHMDEFDDDDDEPFNGHTMSKLGLLVHLSRADTPFRSGRSQLDGAQYNRFVPPDTHNAQYPPHVATAEDVADGSPGPARACAAHLISRGAQTGLCGT